MSVKPPTSVAFCSSSLNQDEGPQHGTLITQIRQYKRRSLPTSPYVAGVLSAHHLSDTLSTLTYPQQLLACPHSTRTVLEYSLQR